MYNVADFNIKMIRSTLKKKGVSLTNRLHKKSTKNIKTLSFEDQCKENTRQQFDNLKLGKFVVNSFMAVKLNKKLKNTDNRFKKIF